MRQLLVPMLLLAGLLTCSHAWAQTRLTGRVTDPSGEPIPNATIREKGTRHGTSANERGDFSLTVMTDKTVLVITAVGYEKLEEPVKGRSSLTLQLNTDAHALSDVVVTGVGVATSRKKVAIDVASVSSQDFAKSATSDVGSALIGQVAGAQIQQTSGSPNSSVNIILRGINTINNGTGPIFLLDGIKIDDINGIDPAIVDHVEVVKGPAAGMLYGSEGANGAIQIFTKRGSRNGHMSITVSSKLSLDNVLTGKRPLNAGFHHYVTDASGDVLDATGNKLAHDAVGYWPDPVEEDYNSDPTVTNSKPFVGLPLYNHLKQAYQQASTYTNAVNIMGGGEKTDYSFTASRLDQQSIFGNKYNRTNMTLNLGLQLAKGFTFRTTTQGIYGYDDLLGGNRFGLINTYPWINFDFRDSIGNLVLKPKNPNDDDITSRLLIPADRTTRGVLRSRVTGRLSGAALLPAIARAYDRAIDVKVLLEDGAALAPGTIIAEIAGPLRSVLAMERVALNFIIHLSGIATLTAEFVAAVAGTSAGIYDIRKTLPGLRALEKYAVACGGGHNHRMGLYDAVLVKDNHLAHLSLEELPTALKAAITRARRESPAPRFVEIEVDTLEQLERVLPLEPDIVLLDNMTLEQTRQSVALRNRLAPGVKLEASGNIRIQAVREIAQTGVDRIAIGFLTHSAPALDIGLDIEP